MKNLSFYLMLALALNGAMALEAMDAKPNAEERPTDTMKIAFEASAPREVLAGLVDPIVTEVSNATIDCSTQAQSIFKMNRQSAEAYFQRLLLYIKQFIVENHGKYELKAKELELNIINHMSEHGFIVINQNRFQPSNTQYDKEINDILNLIRSIAGQSDILVPVNPDQKETIEAANIRAKKMRDLFNPLKNYVAEQLKANGSVILNENEFTAVASDGSRRQDTHMREFFEALREVTQKPATSSTDQSGNSDANERINRQLAAAKKRLDPIIKWVHEKHPQQQNPAPQSWTAGWKGHLLTAAAAGTATLGIAYGVLKYKGYKLSAA